MSFGLSARWLGGTLAASLLVLGVGARAQPPLPLGDAPVRLEGEHVVATALGPLPDDTTLSPGRLSARARGRERALSMLHAWVDGAVAAVPLSPRRVRDVHAALDAHANLRRIRSRADGSAVVELAVPLSVLRDAGCAAGLPWCD